MPTKTTVIIAIVGALLLGGLILWRNDVPDGAQPRNAPRDRELSQMIGTMLVVGFRGTEAPEDSYIANVIRGVRPGAVILFDKDVPSGVTFPRNIVSPDQVRTLINELQDHADYPLLVSIDAEGGLINRLKTSYGFTNIPSHEALGSGPVEETERAACTLARQLADLGITMNFAPVVDVNVNPESPAIGALERSFSADPAVVAAYAEAFVRSHKEAGVHTALKHFPGHGSASGDTHKGVADVSSTWSAQELEPYRILIKKGYADPIMTAHVVNRTFSELPATLSPEVLTDLLRGELGFGGVIISDDLQMGAILNEFGLEEAAVRAVEAGADMLIISNNGETYDEAAPYKVRDALVQAVKDGRLTKERIQESHDRISRLFSNP